MLEGKAVKLETPPLGDAMDAYGRMLVYLDGDYEEQMFAMNYAPKTGAGQQQKEAPLHKLLA